MPHHKRRQVETTDGINWFPVTENRNKGVDLKMKYKMACGNDPVLLGIEDAEGTWDLDKLTEHIQNCHICMCIASKLTKALLLPRRNRRNATSE